MYDNGFIKLRSGGMKIIKSFFKNRLVKLKLMTKKTRVQISNKSFIIGEVAYVMSDIKRIEYDDFYDEYPDYLKIMASVDALVFLIMYVRHDIINHLGAFIFFNFFFFLFNFLYFRSFHKYMILFHVSDFKTRIVSTDKMSIKVIYQELLTRREEDKPESFTVDI